MERHQHPTQSALIAATDGALREVVGLHRPEQEGGGLSGKPYWVCRGCDSGPHADGQPDWPCSTVELIAERVGVSLSSGSA